MVKQRVDALPGFFEAEAAGLRWLGEAQSAGGARVVRVREAVPGRIELERVREGRPDAARARAFGRALAVTHRAGAAAFGAPPTGWEGPLFVGRLEQPRASETSWGRFYAECRVRPYLEPAQANGNLSRLGAALVQRVCDVIAGGRFDDDDPPARLHGDLWTGNVLWSPDGAVLIDPAAHGGHRETDLAMLRLFGCPFLEEILSGYESEQPFRAGWRERVPLHQLHPLAVHAVGHGPSYAAALADAARRVEQLLEA
ncbi:fructosamine kinase family protein [Microbacterium sp. 18062]|uniref:fructosamine kinase family protein n=1 Tax=Microbacterium sp. 18062 TaxID=2681410 RepID=UPI0013584CB3|nr:fructosamine kinase family protein [Microbacterium sp. 18062]